MLLIKGGIHATAINVGEFIIKCPSCESDQWADVMILGKYFYLFFIPIFPTGKEVNVICSKCGLRRYGMPFSSKTLRNYEEIKKDYPHPWFT